MGMLPPEEATRPRQPVQARVEAPAPAADKSEKVKDQEELAAALEELEAEQQGRRKAEGGTLGRRPWSPSTSPKSGRCRLHSTPRRPSRFSRGWGPTPRTGLTEAEAERRLRAGRR